MGLFTRLCWCPIWFRNSDLHGQSQLPAKPYRRALMETYGARVVANPVTKLMRGA